MFIQSDVQNTLALAQQNDLMHVLSSSLSSSIHGHDMIKKDLILQLLSVVDTAIAFGSGEEFGEWDSFTW